MMLIIANTSPFVKTLPSEQTNAAIILCQDGVIAATLSRSWLQFNAVYALESDLIARGLLAAAKENDKLSIINLSQFVELTTSHSPIVNW